MNKKINRIAIIASIYLTGSSSAAILSNLHGDIFSPVDSITLSDWRAFEFRIGANSTTLSEVEGIFVENSSGSLSAWIYSDDESSNAPSVAIGALDASDFSAPFSAISTISLSANTDYWFVIGGTSASSDYTWQFSDTNAFISFPDNPEGFNGSGREVSQALSSDGGANWANIGAGAAWFAIEVRAIPEPSSLGFLSLGVLGFSLRRSRGKNGSSKREALTPAGHTDFP